MGISPFSTATSKADSSSGQRGTWPAFWLLVTNPANGPDPVKQHPWPPEIDMFEMFGHRPTKYTTGYIGRKGEKTKVSQWMHNAGVDLSKDFHTWGLEWDENNIVWTFDGKTVAHKPSPPHSVNRCTS